MRVALDATPLTLSSGGLRRYVEQLSLALATEFPSDTYTLVSDQSFARPECALSNLRMGARPRTRLERHWWLVGSSLALRRAHAQVFHGTNFEVPYLALRPCVLTLHDLSPWKNPAWHANAARVRSRTPWLVRLGIATMVITPSEAVRREAIAYFNLSPERVVAVASAPTHLPGSEETRRSKPYFLFAGTLEPRKNIPMLIEAWREVRKRHDVDLVLAGRQREDFRPLADERGLIVAGEVSDAELATLYKDALAFVYVSHYEGFGLPVLEAMSYGAAVIISRDPALCEIAGDAAIRIASVKELTQSMERVLIDPSFANLWKERSSERAAEFTWAHTAQRTRAVYEESIARYL